MFGTGGQTLARSRRRERPKDGFHWRGPICFSVAGVAEYGKNGQKWWRDLLESSGGRHNMGHDVLRDFRANRVPTPPARL